MKGKGAFKGPDGTNFRQVVVGGRHAWAEEREKRRRATAHKGRAAGRAVKGQPTQRVQEEEALKGALQEKAPQRRRGAELISGGHTQKGERGVSVSQLGEGFLLKSRSYKRRKQMAPESLEMGEVRASLLEDFEVISQCIYFVLHR
ncbi:hypothetical protein GOP47_0017841 [Adiantum capillus-veneris]|uniref:Uncharacterized protein n=1 Tax=Adiantum capillus-veneris TaxID=13818 RepID=A0A9D4Z9K7_ADICA|nr:hypothetical protein GOP47_0017841 [Adiantum capillus-veneris]